MWSTNWNSYLYFAIFKHECFYLCNVVVVAKISLHFIFGWICKRIRVVLTSKGSIALSKKIHLYSRCADNIVLFNLGWAAANNLYIMIVSLFWMVCYVYSSHPTNNCYVWSNNLMYIHALQQSKVYKDLTRLKKSVNWSTLYRSLYTQLSAGYISATL